MADIYLNYSEPDREDARRLALALQSVGWSVCWDQRGSAGQSGPGTREHELQAMRCMVVVWSAASVASARVCEEAALGLQSGKLMAVRIAPVQPPAAFREAGAADLIGWRGDEDFPALQQLIEDIGRLIYRPLLERRTGTASQPTPLFDEEDHPFRQPISARPASAAPVTDERGRWLWIAAGSALLVSAGIGFSAEYWRKRHMESPGAMPEASAAPEPSTKPGVAAQATAVADAAVRAAPGARSHAVPSAR